MKDWSEYIEREVDEVVAELTSQGYLLQSDEPGICDYRNILLQKDEETLELVCVPSDFEEFVDGCVSADETEWLVDDIFENDESFLEYKNNNIKK